MAELESHIYLALTNPVEGRLDELDRWYDEHHMPEVLSQVPGFVAARRYRRNEAQRVPGPRWPEQKPPQHEFMCIYEYEGDAAELHDRVDATSSQRDRTDALAPDHQGWVYTPITERRSTEESFDPELESHIFIALTNPKPGCDEEFNRWYNEEHLPQTLDWVPGFVAGRRYRRHPVQRELGPRWPEQVPPPFEYICIYEIQGDAAQLHRNVESGSKPRTPTDTISDDHQAWVFTPVTPRVTAAEASGTLAGS